MTWGGRRGEVAEDLTELLKSLPLGTGTGEGKGLAVEGQGNAGNHHDLGLG